MSEDEPIFLRSQAQRCRRLAKDVPDEKVARTLRDIAKEYEERAEAIEAKG
jgi:hypothetical protein